MRTTTPAREPHRRAWVVTAAVFLATACTSGPSASGEPSGTPGSTAPIPSASRAETAEAPSPTEAALAYETVSLVGGDGVRLNARLWGGASIGPGSIGVILAHGFSELTGQDDWRTFPDFLAAEGYVVLTFTFRGFCDRDGCSDGPRDLGANWTDVLTAAAYLRDSGVERIFLVGASMGGIAVLRAAQTPDLDFAGVVSLATPQYPSRYYPNEPEANDLTPERLQQITEPKLFIAGTDDVMENVRFADEARSMFESSNDPKALELIDSRQHSSGLVTTAGAEAVAQTSGLIVAFIEEHR